MKKFLYQDLFSLEEKHWWHLAKRGLVVNLITGLVQGSEFKILDIGCGTGKNVEELSKFGLVFGIDNSKQAIDFCRQRGLKNLKLCQADKTGFPKGFFDAVTLLDVLEHADDMKVCKEVHRILKPGGVVIITVPAFPWLWSNWDHILHHKRRYTKKTLQKVLAENKYKILTISYAHSFLVLPALIIRTIKTWFYTNGSYPSDFRISVPFINRILQWISGIELLLITRGSVPFGTSLVAVVQKEADE